jgi:hypothetical protein
MDVNAFSDAAKELELENDELRAENAELRELVHHMCVCMCNIVDADYACEDCPMNNDTQNCDFERRMEELGIEAE